MLLLLAAYTVFPVLNMLAKILGARYPVMQLVWAQYTGHAAIAITVLLLRHPLWALRLHRPLLLLARGMLLVAANLLFFAALRTMPLADALALTFVSPFAAVLLSALLLGETVPPRRWAGIILGLLGALLIIRPGFGSAGAASLLAVGAGISYACFMIATRAASPGATLAGMVVWASLPGALLLSMLMPAVWVTPVGGDIALMAALGAIAALGHALIAAAFARAPASVLAPLGYSEIATTALLGLVVFGQFPDAITWAGIAVLAAGGLWMARAERRT